MKAVLHGETTKARHGFGARCSLGRHLAALCLFLGLLTFGASNVSFAHGDHGCQGASCSHGHEDVEAISKVASHWRGALDNAKESDASQNDTLLEVLGRAMIADLMHEEKRRDAQNHGHHHHDREEVAQPSRFSRPWLKAKLQRIKSAVPHIAGDIVEGAPEYGLVFASITFAAEAVDHLVMDELIPVIGMIPMCVLIADFARRASTFVSEGAAVWTYNARWSSPFPLAAFSKWLEARKKLRQDSKHYARPPSLKDGRGTGLKLERPGLMAKVRKTETPYTEVAEDLPSELKFLFENTPLWHEVARQWTEGKTDTLRDLDLNQKIRHWLSTEGMRERPLANRAFEFGSAARLSKQLMSSMVQGHLDDKKFKVRDMFRLRFAVGRFGRSIRRFETDLLKRLVGEDLPKTDADKISRDVLSVLAECNKALERFTHSLEHGNLREARETLRNHREGVKSITRNFPIKPRSHRAPTSRR